MECMSVIHRAVRGITDAETPVMAATAILDVCVAASGAEHGRIHLLDLKASAYVPFAPRIVGTPAVAPAVDDVVIPESRIASLAELGAFAEGAPADGTAAFALRGSSCIGAVVLYGAPHDALDEELRRELVDTAGLLVPIFEDQFAYNLLTTLQDPLDFMQPEEQFLADIGLLVALSTGMEFAAVWEAVDEGLRCIAIWGLGEGEEDRRRWDLDDRRAVPMAQAALDGATFVCTGDGSGDDEPALRVRGFEQVTSYVLTPIKVGSEGFGLLGVGARCAFHYAPLELRGFESVANTVGVAIRNFRSSHALASQVVEFAETSVAITAIEVAQTARHEAAGLLDNCQAILAGVNRKLGRHLAVIADDVHELETELLKVNRALDRIKTATKPPERERRRLSLQRVWEEARTLVAGRLGELRVSVHYQGPDVEVDGYADWLRQVFLNLLLNSLDAYRERDPKKQGRQISLAVERPSDRARDYTLTYRDNAGGISPQRLRLQPEHEGMPLAQVIFEPTVTSKPDGSGFGLWLVRRILTTHQGSIDLVDHRLGATFALRLPKPADMASGRSAA
jgi:signal transduction histidine kinase